MAVAVAAREPLKAAIAQVRGPAASTAPSTSRNPPSPAVPPTASPRPSPTAPQPAAPGSTGRDAPRVTVAPLTDAEQGAGSAAPARPAPAAETPPAATERVASVPRPPSRKARLFFTAVDAAGGIELRSVIRSIPASDSPLKDTLESLLKGPTAQELNLGLVSMIPTEARLRGVVVKDDTAVIDFNEGFRFNSQGLDAMNAELRQVVYAATEFPSVRRVLIHIEGQSVQYLGTEGMRLDQPLTRDSFGKQS